MMMDRLTSCVRGPIRVSEEAKGTSHRFRSEDHLIVEAGWTH